MSLLCHDMFAFQVVGYNLVDDRNLIEVILGFLTLSFGGVGDTSEVAFPSHQNLVWGQTAFAYSIMEVKEGSGKSFHPVDFLLGMKFSDEAN
jgi:hypothetical protein